MSEAMVREADRGLAEPMIDPEVVRQVRTLASYGWGAKRIARELGLARNTVRSYLRAERAPKGERPFVGRKLAGEARREAVRLFDGPAEGNAVVVRTLLEERGTRVSARTVQRAVRGHRDQKRAAERATVRFETEAGEQMQIDFGEKWVRIAGALVKVYFLVAVLSYSRRLFVRAFLSQRQDDWREGLAAAFRHFGGVPRTLLCDNAGPLVKGRDAALGRVTFHPAFAAFCRDWGVLPRACRPYRARTKGKTESGVKFVKRNGVAGRDFDSFAALDRHLEAWSDEADRRVHGTTHEAPLVRFERDERHALRPLPARPLVVRERRLRRKVANDALVDVDTVRYSVPHRLVGQSVEVLVGETDVVIHHGAALVATHPRSREPRAVVRQAVHYEGLWRPAAAAATTTTARAAGGSLAALGRSLDDYADAIGGAR